MRALPGPSGGGGGGRGHGGCGSGGGYRDAELDVLPGAVILLVGLAALPFLAAWVIDLFTAAWCHAEGPGCVSTHYLADLVHVLVIGALCVAGLAVAAFGYRRRWHVAVAWTALVVAAWAVRRIRAARARRGAVRHAHATSVRVVVLGDDDVVVAEEAPARPLTAGRGVYDGGWIAQPVPPVRNGVDTRR